MTRVLTALLLLPIVLGIVWFLPPIGTVVLAAAAAVAATIELATIAASLSAPFPRVLVACAVGAACVSVGLGVIPLEAVLLGAMVLIGAVTVATRQPGPSALHGASAAMFAIAYVGVPLGAVAAIQVLGGREAVILLVVTIVASDSAQYYAGRAFGRTPLAPAISPKKTREGAIGGVVFGTAVMTLGGRIVFPAASWVVLAATGLGVVLSGIIGDLFESLLKRGAGIKDSSALIPGHGGILDRIDSWLFAGPVYYFFVRYLQA
jgi:phosphatidate cytidylyltransferase